MRCGEREQRGRTKAIGAVVLAVDPRRRSCRHRDSSLTRHLVRLVVQRLLRVVGMAGARRTMIRRARGEIEIVLTGASGRRVSVAADFAAEMSAPPPIADATMADRRTCPDRSDAGLRCLG